MDDPAYRNPAIFNVAYDFALLAAALATMKRKAMRQRLDKSAAKNNPKYNRERRA